jgi:hypothetical protein
VAIVTERQRKAFAKMGIAMPDGSYYIRNAGDLQNAIDSVGRATPNGSETPEERRNAIRRHIIKRAEALKLANKIPDTWNSDGSLKHMSSQELMGAYLEHFGRKGMKWGAHVFGTDRGSGSGGGSSHVSPDAARAHASALTIKKHGTSALSNQDLQHLVTRLQLERQHGQLNQRQVGLGEKVAKDVLVNVGKQTATSFATKYATKGTEKLIKLAAKGAVSAGKHALS